MANQAGIVIKPADFMAKEMRRIEKQSPNVSAPVDEVQIGKFRYVNYRGFRIMASFPKNEANMLILGRQMVDGFKAKAEIFPSPPVAPGDLENALEECVRSREAAIEAQAAAEQATAAKNAAFEAFAEKMKVDPRYAEDAVNDDDAKLRTIGWGRRKPATPLATPGQARNLAVREQGEKFCPACLGEAGRGRQGERLPDPALGTDRGRSLDADGDCHGNGEFAFEPATGEGAGVLRDRDE